MSSYYYAKSSARGVRRVLRLCGLAVFAFGFIGLGYVFFPFLSWQVYFAPVFAQQVFAAPIPQTTVINQTTVTSLLEHSRNALSSVDYTDAQNWFPGLKKGKGNASVAHYMLTIPKLGIHNAVVSTRDYNLAKHLVNYSGTAVPPEKGNVVIFGHSTLPQLFNPKDYTTIFATAYKLQLGDEIHTTIRDVTYQYKIFSITVVDPSDTSVFVQNYDASYLTIVTCTPPGTTWKRLIIKSQIQTI